MLREDVPPVPVACGPPAPRFTSWRTRGGTSLRLEVGADLGDDDDGQSRWNTSWGDTQAVDSPPLARVQKANA